MFGKSKKIREEKTKKRRMKIDPEHEAKYASTSKIASKFLMLGLVLTLAFGVFDATISTIKAGGGGADAEQLSSGMYELSQAVATGSWWLTSLAKTKSSSSTKDKESAFYISSDSTYSLWPTNKDKTVYKPELNTATNTYEYKLGDVENPTANADKAWPLAANLIGMYNAYGLTSNDNGNKPPSSPGNARANNEFAWDLNSVLTGYTYKDGSGKRKITNVDYAIARYWYFGKSLTDAGILEYTTAGSGTGSSLRPIFGYGTYASYVMATTASSVFNTCIQIAAKLDIVNVFETYASHVEGGSTTAYTYGDTTNKIMTAITGSGFMRTLANVYVAVRKARYVILFLMIIILITNFTLFKPLSSFTAAQEMRSKTIKFIVRCLMMFGGVPLLALLYHMCLYTVITGGTTGKQDMSTTMNLQAGTSVGNTNNIQMLDTDDSTLMQSTKQSAATNNKSIMSDDLINAYVMSTFIDMDYVISHDFAIKKENASDKGIELVYTYSPDTKKLSVKSSTRLSTLAYNLNGFKGQAALDAALFDNGGATTTTTKKVFDNMQSFNVSNVYQGINNGVNFSTPDPTSRAVDANTVRQLLISYADGEKLDLAVGASNIADYSTQVSGGSSIYKDSIKGAFGDDSRLSNYAKFAQTVNSDLTLLFAYSPSHKWGDKDQYILTGDDKTGMIYMKSHSLSAFYGLTGIPIEIKKGTESGATNTSSEATISLYGPLLKLPKYDNMTIGVNDKKDEIDKKLGDEETATLVKVMGYTVSSVYGDPSAKNGQVINADPVKITYNEDGAHFSQLGKYNFIHTAFTADGFTVYDPQTTLNDATGMRMYRVSIVYNDLQEIAQVLYLNAVLLSFGMLGWIFGLTTIANILVEFVQLIPSLFKTMVGSAKGFAHAVAVVLTIVFEILVTIVVYTYAIQFIDFIIRFVGSIIGLLGDNMTGNNMSGILNILACLIISALLMWSVSLLIKFRKAIVLWFTGLIKNVMTTIFRVLGFNDADINNDNVGNANGNKLAMAGAGLVAAGALASTGDLDSIANDLSNSKLGQQMGENLGKGVQDASEHMASGDFAGAGAALTSGMMDDTAFSNFDPGNYFGSKDDTQQNADSQTSGRKDSVDALGKDNSVDALGNATNKAINGEGDTTTPQGDNASYADGMSYAGGDASGLDSNNVSAAMSNHTDEISSKARKGQYGALNSNMSTKEKTEASNSPLGLTKTQTQNIQDAIDAGASDQEVASMVADYQEDNFGSTANANAYLAANGQTEGQTFTTSNGDSVTISSSNIGGSSNGQTSVGISHSNGDTSAIITGSYGKDYGGTYNDSNGQTHTDNTGVSSSQVSDTLAAEGFSYNRGTTASYQNDAIVNGGMLSNNNQTRYQDSSVDTPAGYNAGYNSPEGYNGSVNSGDTTNMGYNTFGDIDDSSNAFLKGLAGSYNAYDTSYNAEAAQYDTNGPDSGNTGENYSKLFDTDN